jgi:glycosyltransferase involved in cell wall biosynthesis
MSDVVLVSVIVPVYNAEKYITEAVESILAESKNIELEIILVEDCSSDNSLAVCKGIAEKYPNMVYLLQHPDKGNYGAGASRNLGIKHSNGSLICFLDADDYWLPGRLDEALRVLSEQKAVDGVYDLAEYIFYSDNESEKFKEHENIVGVKDIVKPESLYDYLFSGGATWCTNGIIVRREVFDRIGYFNTELRLAQDTELWYRMAAGLKLIGSNTGKPVAVYRRHGGNRYQPDRKGGWEDAWSSVYGSLLEWLKTREMPASYCFKPLKEIIRIKEYQYKWKEILMISKENKYFIGFLVALKLLVKKTIKVFKTRIFLFVNDIFFKRKNGEKMECDFWDQWLENSGIDWVEDYQYRISEKREVKGYHAEIIQEINKESIEILDVGSGPISTIGTHFRDYILNLCCADPLADKYDILLKKHGISSLNGPVSIGVENLTDKFELNTFDWVNCQNSLDHSNDPVSGIKQIIDVCKINGIITLVHNENEADRENWSGLHQWNFTIKGGDMQISNKSNNYLLSELIKDSADILEASLKNNTVFVKIRKS